MIEILSSWAKNIILAIIVISILEMLLPNNKTKKYVKMVMGLYLLFNIISPLVKNKDKLNFNDFDINTYVSSQTQNTNINTVNQESMDKRLNEIYVEELQKDIKEKLENQGYSVEKCDVKAEIDNTAQSSGIKKISLKVEKNNKDSKNVVDENNNKNDENYLDEEKDESNMSIKSNENLETANNKNNIDSKEEIIDDKDNNKKGIENIIVEEIQKIKEVKIGQGENQTSNKEDEENSILNTDISKIKAFLVDEYEVSEECLEIN